MATSQSLVTAMKYIPPPDLQAIFVCSNSECSFKHNERAHIRTLIQAQIHRYRIFKVCSTSMPSSVCAPTFPLGAPTPALLISPCRGIFLSVKVATAFLIDLRQAWPQSETFVQLLEKPVWRGKRQLQLTISHPQEYRRVASFFKTVPFIFQLTRSVGQLLGLQYPGKNQARYLRCHKQMPADQVTSNCSYTCGRLKFTAVDYEFQAVFQVQAFYDHFQSTAFFPPYSIEAVHLLSLVQGKIGSTLLLRRFVHVNKFIDFLELVHQSNGTEENNVRKGG